MTHTPRKTYALIRIALLFVHPLQLCAATGMPPQLEAEKDSLIKPGNTIWLQHVKNKQRSSHKVEKIIAAGGYKVAISVKKEGVKRVLMLPRIGRKVDGKTVLTSYYNQARDIEVQAVKALGEQDILTALSLPVYVYASKDIKKKYQRQRYNNESEPYDTFYASKPFETFVEEGTYIFDARKKFPGTYFDQKQWSFLNDNQDRYQAVNWKACLLPLLKEIRTIVDHNLQCYMNQDSLNLAFIPEKNSSKKIEKARFFGFDFDFFSKKLHKPKARLGPEDPKNPIPHFLNPTHPNVKKEDIKKDFSTSKKDLNYIKEVFSHVKNDEEKQRKIASEKARKYDINHLIKILVSYIFLSQLYHDMYKQKLKNLPKRPDHPSQYYATLRQADGRYATLIDQLQEDFYSWVPIKKDVQKKPAPKPIKRPKISPTILPIPSDDRQDDKNDQNSDTHTGAATAPWQLIGALAIPLLVVGALFIGRKILKNKRTPRSTHAKRRIH